ncbi:helicase-related protein [Micromonospora sp. NBC_01796]|nr:helicase-related protein [Micromonospora sp. NBC_01796]
MGKTYVALGVVALLRHFQPDLRLLVIAPRANIQHKWQREQNVFTANNVRLDDLRVRMPDGLPARPLVHCDSLIELLEETAVAPDRDFFVRLPSFSLPLRQDPAQRRPFRDRLRRQIPWLPDELVDLRANAEVVKDRFAQAINAALPHFDLVIVDEAHNLKHGWGPHASARNRVLATALGRQRDDIAASLQHAYGARAGKVLLLSATPVDDDYRQLWNQLDLLGRGGPFAALRAADATEDQKRDVTGRFLIRRVTSLKVAGQQLTKNLYRREWRQGGLTVHDEPIQITDDRQRLTVALVQKKVSDLLGHERFGARFQVGMLASFESFLQTSGATGQQPDDPTDDEQTPNFDGADQATDVAERQGADVPMLDELARDHARRFGRELPHPKMDALVDALSSSWRDGHKGLVFVRRVASVAELKRKLDDEYNDWLITRLRGRLHPRHHGALDTAVADYRDHRSRHTVTDNNQPDNHDEDSGGDDTFFAWFFRGRGPDTVISGARIQERFRNLGSPLGIFFDDNHVMDILDAAPGEVVSRLAAALGEDPEKAHHLIREHSRHYLSEAKQPTRGARFDAAQAAALELLAATTGPQRARAEVAWWELYRPRKQQRPAAGAAEADLLETRTFFTELRRRSRLRSVLWPQPTGDNLTAAFREQHQRGQLLSAASRLGHAFLDLYTIVTDHLRSLNPSEGMEPGTELIAAWLDELERQAHTTAGNWSAYDELKNLARHHDLIIDTTLPELRRADLRETSTHVSRLLTAQQPVAGMSGRVNRRLVQQFRLPGYPLVLICTDLLQEGEDLHTFCSRVYHYGLAWTPSAIEQRIGRIDRMRSQTERRLTKPCDTVSGDDLLQVHYPHLADTIERLQVRRVLHRVNDFLRLMHEGLTTPPAGDGHLDIAWEALADDGIPPVHTEPLVTSFPVRAQHLAGRDRPLAVNESRVQQHLDRFAALADSNLHGVTVEWERHQPSRNTRLGTMILNTGSRQPFSLHLSHDSGHLVVRCVTLVGSIERDEQWRQFGLRSGTTPARLGVVRTRGGSYDLTVEEDVPLTSRRHDRARVSALLDRVAALAEDAERQHLPDRDRLLTGIGSGLRGVRHRAEWRTLCDAEDMRVRRHGIVVRFAKQRSHTVQIQDLIDAYLVTAVIAHHDDLAHQPSTARNAWFQNRYSSLVGFRVAADGHLVAQGWTPKDGLTANAFQAIVRAVARQAHRYEFRLTGAAGDY